MIIPILLINMRYTLNTMLKKTNKLIFKPFSFPVLLFRSVCSLIIIINYKKIMMILIR